MKRMAEGAVRIFLACGCTDFRKQIPVEWLLQGLEIEQKKAHHQVKINRENTCF